MKKIFLIFAILSVFLNYGCDKDTLADINTDPSVISEPDLRFSMATAIENVYSNEYLWWFYNNYQYIYPWSQVTVAGGSNGFTFNEMGVSGGNQYLYGDLMRQTRDIQFRIDGLPKDEQANYSAFKHVTYPLQILPAIWNTDLTGSLAYTEAALAPFTTPSLVTPVYDSQETLFNTWLEELDNAIDALHGTPGTSFDVGDQDLIYGGDYEKWAKLCNTLKLRIAARLVNKDLPRAIKIAEEVAKSEAKYMDDLTDDFIYRRDDKWYGSGNGLSGGYGTKNLLDFMVSNRDPRARFFFIKNNFNAEVVQGFIDSKVDLPPYVEKYVVKDTDGNFKEWAAPGEPWVRYFGVPASPDLAQDPDYKIYFEQSNLYKITMNKVEKDYRATSTINYKTNQTTKKYTYPTIPSGRVIEMKGSEAPLHVILATSAEVNLYFAEFALLGADLPKTAQEYLNKGVELSVRRANAVAKTNEFYYYEDDPVYEDAIVAESAGTKLRAGEIESLLEQDICKLTSDALEKVYLQQYINFINTPGGVWTTVRRSGYPKKGSAYLAWEETLSGGKEMVMPRRFVIGQPTEDNLNYANQKAAIDEQGFTPSTNDAATLNSERLWWDKESPNYGNGTK
ncbi:MAG: SusD/RagB family nutrient-binding outer membrane lipoprotein [Carboxylicivirga sp.]|jgi:hypothetical protein|nr:SusD/RagB family nutrient-binding outer membrane lipoprotein [Carboxylicivirga sp.]